VAKNKTFAISWEGDRMITLMEFTYAIIGMIAGWAITYSYNTGGKS
jgi:hypothetical protein